MLDCIEISDLSRHHLASVGPADAAVGDGDVEALLLRHHLVADHLVDPESFADGRVATAEIALRKCVAVAILDGRLEAVSSIKVYVK